MLLIRYTICFSTVCRLAASLSLSLYFSLSLSLYASRLRVVLLHLSRSLSLPLLVFFMLLSSDLQTALV